MQRDEILETLQLELQIPDLAFNASHVCRLVFDHRLTVDLECQPDQNVLHIYSVVGQDTSLDAAGYRELLSANLFGHGSGEAVLAIDDQRDEILLFRSWNLDTLTSAQLTKDLVQFVAAAGTWQDRLQGGGIASDETVPDSAAMRV